MRIGGALSLVVMAAACGCGSSSKPAAPQHVSTYELQSKLLGQQLDQVLVTPRGGGKGHPLLVFLHGYSGSPAGTLDPAFVAALRKLGDRAPVVVLPDGQVGWWHDRREGQWGSYVLHEVIPAALARSGADGGRVAIGGISMGGFGALDLGRIEAKRFCAVGGHSPAVYERGTADSGFGFDDQADFDRHDLLGIASKRLPYAAPVWIDVGGSDFLRTAVKKLAKELEAHGADVTFHVWPGGHEGQYWDKHFAAYLRFYADACS
jgi:S-formylglutathione hydrolase FrmB